MTASKADVQQKIAAAIAELKLTGSSGQAMVSAYGPDTSKWPAGHWLTGMSLLGAASTEVGDLIDPDSTTPAPPSPPLPSDGMVAQPQPPPFTAKRTLPKAMTWTELQTALAALQPGDRLPCSGIVMPSEASFSRKLTAPAEIVFDSTCKANGGKGKYLPAIDFANVANLRFISQGMVVTNPTLGAGIKLSGSDHCVYDGFDVRNCATDATRMFPTAADIVDNYFRATVRDWGLVKSLDDHPEDGTGLHGCNMENSGATTHHLDRNTVVLTTPGSKVGGSLLEIGTSRAAWVPTGNRAWLQAANMLQDALTQTAGNALNLWGYLGALDVLWVGATGMHGYAVHSSPYGTYQGVVKVEAGSAMNCCLNPRYKGQNPWMKNGGIKYPNPSAVVPMP